MQQPPKDSNEDQLPHAELNPLLNPLLAEHMGRWAEVYFTNPPEKREQAITELLRELGDGPSPENSSAAPSHEIVEEKAEHTAEASFEPRGDHDWRDENTDADSWRQLPPEPRSNPPGKESGRICANCGHPNSDLQRFCGMCGASLLTQSQSMPAKHSGPSQDAEAVAFAGSSWSQRGLSPTDISEEDALRHTADSARFSEAYAPNFRFSGSAPVERSSTEPSYAEDISNSEPASSKRSEQRANEQRSNEQRSEAHYRPKEHYPEHYPRNYEDRELPLPPERAPAFEGIPSFGVEAEAESVPYRYRAYVGVVLVIVIGALLYMMWRNKQTPSGAAVLQSQPAPSAAGPEAGASAPAGQGAPQNSGSRNDAARNSAKKNGAPAKATPALRPEAPSQKPNAARRPAPSPSPAPSVPQAPGAQGGSEELNTAEGYLQGKPGRARDSQEAAKWLWRSVAKQNLTAALVLSDLYVRGDGVPKSCDQARLLLDVAARKGSSAAADRLRNLSASGCQ